MANLIPYITPTLLIPLVVIVAIFCFFWYYWRVVTPRRGTVEWAAQAGLAPKPFTFAGRCHPMTRRDLVPLLLLTAAYAVTAFWSLGSFINPQSFARLTGETHATITFTNPVTVSRIMYYGGLNTGSYTLEVSPDGQTWLSLWPETREDGTIASYYWASGVGYDPARSLSQTYSQLFKWQERTPTTAPEVKFLRLTGRPDAGDDFLSLGELALYDENGRLIPAEAIAHEGEDSGALMDEQNTVPAASTWYNSTYFDEIYHPRTALEHIEGMTPYEKTHPPLGKLILGLGIRLFGMTPFGWRFMGTLFGVAMLPLLYVFLKNIFGKTLIATCGTALFACDFMHLTQTRIGTIDTYGVFFILAMYFFMYRYLTIPPGAPFRKGALPLFLSGLMWGLGAASKWTVIYGAVGLALLYFIGLYFRLRDWPCGEGAPPFAPYLTKTLLFSVLCFVVMPAAIYTAAYLPYAVAQNDATLSGTIKAMLENQKYMLSYHQGVTETHPYSSRWYQWMVDGRPILYYLDTSADGLKTAFGAFNNPIISWVGLPALLICACQSFRRRWSKAAFFLLSALCAVVALVFVDGIFAPALGSAVLLRNGAILALGLLLYLGFGAFATLAFPGRSSVALFITVGYLSQLVPWMAIGRTTFAYHYFPSVIFLVLALCYVMNTLARRKPKGWKVAVYGLTGSAGVLYAAFYPVLVGIAIPTWYSSNLLRWLPSWPF